MFCSCTIASAYKVCWYFTLFTESKHCPCRFHLWTRQKCKLTDQCSFHIASVTAVICTSTSAQMHHRGHKLICFVFKRVRAPRHFYCSNSRAPRHWQWGMEEITALPPWSIKQALVFSFWLLFAFWFSLSLQTTSKVFIHEQWVHKAKQMH